MAAPVPKVATTEITDVELHPQAQWESLPPDLQEHVLWYLYMAWFLPPARYSDLRLVSKSFAAMLRRWLWLYCPEKHPDFADHFVGGVVRFSAEGIAAWYDKKMLIPPSIYSWFYGRVYDACMKPHFKAGPMYTMLFDKVRVLTMDGTLSDMTGKKRDKFIRFVKHVFLYIDRFYVKRFALPDVATHVVAAFEAAEAEAEA